MLTGHICLSPNLKWRCSAIFDLLLAALCGFRVINFFINDGAPIFFNSGLRTDFVSDKWEVSDRCNGLCSSAHGAFLF